MKIAFTSKGPAWDSPMDERFGRTDYLVILDDQSMELTAVSNQDSQAVAHGAGPKTAQKLFDLAPDVLITGNGPGGNAAAVLNRMKIKIYTGAGGLTIRSAYEQFKHNQLKGG